MTSKHLESRLNSVLIASIRLLLATLLFCFPLISQAIIYPQPNEDNLVLMEVRLDAYQVTDLLIAYQHAGGVVVPLQKLSQLLGINIRTNPSEGTADGFIINENRTFYLDLPKNQVTINGETSPIPENSVLVNEDDIFVDSQLIGQWLPFKLNVDLYGSRIKVLPTEKLPFVTRIEREQRMRETRKAIIHEDPGYPRRESPYQFWNVPTIDQTFDYEYHRRPDMGAESQLHYTTYATMDLLFMESSWFLSGDKNHPTDDFRLTLGRKDPEAKLLGPLHATEFAIGDISLPSSTLISKAHAPAIGAMISNMRLSQQNQFDSHSFRGNLPSGWDVELYQNNSLLDFQQSRADGQYNFNDVPLLYGMNYFRLVFYGPYGERREEKHRFILGQTLTPPGQLNYRLMQNEDKDGQQYTLADFNLGLLKQASFNLGFNRLPVDDTEHRYGHIGIRSFLSDLSLNADYAEDDNGSSASQLGVQTRIASLNILANRIILDRDYVSEEFIPQTDQIHYRNQLRFDSAIPPTWLPRIPVTLQLERDINYSGMQHTLISNRLSTFFSGYALSNQLRWDKFSTGNILTDGSLQLSRRLQRYGLRGSLLYTLQPASKWTNLNISMQGPLQNNFRFNTDYSRSFNNNLNTYSFGINRQHGHFAIGTTLSYSSDDELRLNLIMSAGIGHEPRQQQWFSEAKSIARSGTSSIQVFLDNNQNGQLDKGDKPLKGIGFNINGSNNTARTNDNGIAYLTDLPVYQRTNLDISAETLADPLWVAQIKGVNFVPRPGHTNRFDFPITMTSEIDGTIYLQHTDGKQELADVKIRLLNMAGEIIQETESEFDGFYILPAIPPGKYLVQVSPEQVEKYGLVMPEATPVSVQADGNFISGFDLVLSKANTQETTNKHADTAPSHSPAATTAETENKEF